MLESKMYSHLLHKDLCLPELYVLYARKQESVARLRALKRQIQSTQDEHLRPGALRRGKCA